MSNDKTSAPFIHPESRLKISMGALVGILATTVAGALAWSVVRTDVATNGRAIVVHDKRIEVIETRVATDHDILLEIRSDLKALSRERSK